MGKWQFHSYGSYHHVVALQDRLQSIETMMRNNLHKLSPGAVEQLSPSDEHPESSISPGASPVAETSSFYTPSALPSCSQAYATGIGPSIPATEACAAKANMPSPGKLGKYHASRN